MLRFNQKPNEKQILQAASLATLISLPVEVLGAVANDTVYLKTEVSATESDFVRERATLYAFYIEEQLRWDFADDYFSANDADLENLEFHLIHPPRVSNAIHGMSLSYYANRIQHNLPNQWRYFRICVPSSQSPEAALETIRNALYGERNALEASYAWKDGCLFVEFVIMATFDDQKRAYRMQWLQAILKYLERHHGLEAFAPREENAAARAGAANELATAASESALDRLAREYFEFASYWKPKEPASPIFDLDLDLEPLIPPKDATACIETIRAIRLEAQGKMD